MRQFALFFAIIMEHADTTDDADAKLHNLPSIRKETNPALEEAQAIQSGIL